MRAVLFVGHGSRSKRSNEQFIQFANAVGASCKAPLFRYAFLELADPSILDEIKVCVEKGATEIIVFPLLLFTAGHAKVDIPNEIDKGKVLFPDVTFTMEKPLGIQEVLISILEKRLSEKNYINQQNSLVILVGRGSNDESAINDFEKVGELLRERLHTSHVRTSYLVGGHTSFEDSIRQAHESSYENIYVLPYLLFKGVLLTQMEVFVRKLNDERFSMCQSIGADETVVNLVSTIINHEI
ncbi:sirohydrochlorin chelatase [Anaerobacillus alkaliphilus]|uniref:Sirohydrochlorin chelatase n=1 Tax=Anaerobacillus alkaliphilus TaxID=1548597 RepID=A0A4Q0VWR5_9BACI|nr:sirohydrochlorin chelatase [Anaerobacillus alkaliphilus]RXJ04084.1 sirohydrochlorin chelatase [Anaerobacillus alkaliphilus]